jgi:hypothetical protein
VAANAQKATAMKAIRTISVDMERAPSDFARIMSDIDLGCFDLDQMTHRENGTAGRAPPPAGLAPT